MKMLLSIAAGGALGAVGRYLLMSQIGAVAGSAFPYATLAVNVVGSFVLGVLVEVMALVWSPTPEMRALLVVGVLGAFTTFSTFSMDVYFLAERGQAGFAWLYICLSVILAVGAFFLAIHLMRTILA